MNELLQAKNGPTIDSREIAEMMGINHWEILRKLDGTEKTKGIIKTLGDNKIVVTDYFIKSAYTTDQNKEMPCYQFTKMGCEFIANKFTGEKGILFTAKYVKRFNDMEDMVKPQLSKELQAIIMIDQKQQQIESKITAVNADLQDFKQDMPLLGIECDRITISVKRKGVECLGGKKSTAYQDSSLRHKVYSDIYGQLKREFGVGTYKAIKRNQSDLAVEIIDGYKTPLSLGEQIEQCNLQVQI